MFRAIRTPTECTRTSASPLSCGVAAWLESLPWVSAKYCSIECCFSAFVCSRSCVHYIYTFISLGIVLLQVWLHVGWNRCQGGINKFDSEILWLSIDRAYCGFDQSGIHFHIFKQTTPRQSCMKARPNKCANAVAPWSEQMSSFVMRYMLA